MVSALVVGTNTYRTLAEADTYMGDHVSGSTWAGKDPDTKAKCLITAFSIFQKQCWQGAKTVAAQAAQFPRTGLTDKNGVAVDSAVVPAQVGDAQVLLAAELAADPSIAAAGGIGSNVKSLKAGSAAIDYFRPSGGPEGAGSQRFSTEVQELIGQFLCGALGSSGGIAGAYASGTDVASSFDDIEQYGLNAGF